MAQNKTRLRKARIAALLTGAVVLLGGFQNCARARTKIVILESFSSLFSNSGFEEGTKGFDLADEGTVAEPGSADVNSMAAHAGSYGLRLNKMSVSPSLESYPMLKPGKVYMISFWARLVAHAPLAAVESYPYMEVKTGFSNGVRSGPEMVYVPETLNKIRVQNTQWQKFEYAIEPGQRSGYLWILNIVFTPSPGSDNVVDIDDLSIEEVVVE